MKHNQNGDAPSIKLTHVDYLNLIRYIYIYMVK